MSRDLLGGTGLPKGHSLQFMGAPGALRTEAVPPSAREFRRGGFARVERCPHSRLVRVCYTSDCWFWRGGRASVGFGEGPTCSSGLHASTSLLSQSTLICLFLSGADCNARSHPHTDPHDTTSTLALHRHDDTHTHTHTHTHTRVRTYGSPPRNPQSSGGLRGFWGR